MSLCYTKTVELSKLLFSCRRKPFLEIVFWTFSRVCAKKEREICLNCFLRVKSISSEKKISDFALNTCGRWAKGFQQGSQNCILKGVQPNNLGKVFFSLCSKYFRQLSAKIFLPESSKLQFMERLEHFGDIFPIWAKIFGFWEKFLEDLPELLFKCPGDFFGKISLRNLREKCPAVFSKTAFYIEWRTFPRKCCRSSTWKFLDSAQNFFKTVIKTVKYIFDTTFSSIFFRKKRSLNWSFR